MTSSPFLAPWSEALRRGRGAFGLGLAGLALAGTSAYAAQQAAPGAGPSEVIFLAQIVTLLLVGRLLGEAMHRIGQPTIMGQLLAGVLLGPSIFGAFLPEWQGMLFPASGAQKSMIEAVSQLGILLLLLVTGMETDLALVKKLRRAAFSTSLAGISIPFACGFALGEMLPDAMLPNPDQRLVTSIFLGTALSISSVKIVASVIREMDFMRRNVGQIIVATAIIDDTIGWIIIAITFSLATQGAVDLASVAKSVVGTLVFLGVSFTIGRRVVYFAIRWTNDNFASDYAVITAVLVIMGAMALTTHLIGVHSVLGAFVAGILVGESPILARQIEEALRGLITALFMPVFFGLAGLSTDLRILADPNLLLLTLGLIAIASFGKFAGAFVGGQFGGLTRPESLALACGMNARGSTEVIVATIGLSMGVLTQNLFTMIVTMAVVTTMAMPPMLRAALRRLPMNEDEKKRLAREEFEEDGFVANLERLLVAADDTAKGRFAARIAGIIAGSRGMPVTMLPVGEPPPEGQPAPAEPRAVETAAKAAAETAKPSNGEDEEAAALDIRTLDPSPASEETVAAEAKKGYDLLIVGVEPTVAAGGGFHDDVSRIARGFHGPLAIVSARGAHLADPLDPKLKILLPITGTEVSRRASEVALTLASATGASITALYVAARPTRPAGRPTLTTPDEKAMLRALSERAKHFNATIRTAVRTDISPEDAILRQARAGDHNLIIMGVDRRAGERLFFGNTAMAVLESADRSLLFVSN